MKNPNMAKGLKKKTKPAKPPMYYKAEADDLNLMGESDVGTMDSADPMDTDGYGPEDDQGLAGIGGATDPFSLPGEGKMPASDRPGKLSKLRKRGMPG